VNLRDVRMVERGQSFRFALKANQPLGVGGERFRQDLQRDVPLQARVACAKDFAHAAGTDRAKDLVRSELRSGGERHASAAGGVRAARRTPIIARRL
jgi:hypothetical protein